MQKVARVFAVLLIAAACGGGGDSKVPPPTKKAEAKGEGGGGHGGDKGQTGKKGQKGMKDKKGKAEELMVYPKVEDRYRTQLTKEQLSEDSEGLKNRDPFRSFLLKPTIERPPPPDVGRGDVCEERNKKGQLARWRATQFGIRDLRLAGIMKMGNRGCAMFIDNQRLGHFAYRGDCLSKEKVRIKDIGDSCVTLVVQPEPPPGGGPAPPPFEDSKCVNATELSPVTEESSEAPGEKPGGKKE